jgi:hypothetical protein
MKKIILIGIIILAIAATAGGWYWWQQNNSDVETAVLVYESGLVSYKLPAANDYQVLELEEFNLPTGSFVKTDAGSYARIFLPDNSLISLDEKTEIQLNYSPKAVDVQQLVGQTWNRVQTLTQGGTYQVQTPTTIAAVRGTVFGVSTDEDKFSEIFVEESSVDVDTYIMENGQVKKLVNIILQVGEMLNVDPEKLNKALVKKAIIAKIKEGFWYKRNKILDEAFDGSKVGTRGIRLRQLIAQKLRQRVDFGEFLFGISPVDAGNTAESLADVRNILQVDENTCSRFTAAEIQSAINKVQRYARFIARAGDLEKILRQIKSTCADGEVTVDEAEKLQVLIGEFRK